MASFNSDLIAAQTGVSYADKMIAGDRLGGLPLLATAIITLSAATAANDVFQLFDLPAQAVIVPQLSSITCADPGTTLTLDVGDAGDPNRYADTINVAAGGTFGFASGTMPAAVATPYQPAAVTRIYATATAAGTVTAAVKVVVVIAYRIKG